MAAWQHPDTLPKALLFFHLCAMFMKTPGTQDTTANTLPEQPFERTLQDLTGLPTRSKTLDSDAALSSLALNNEIALGDQ